MIFFSVLVIFLGFLVSSYIPNLTTWLGLGLVTTWLGLWLWVGLGLAWVVLTCEGMLSLAVVHDPMVQMLWWGFIVSKKSHCDHNKFLLEHVARAGVGLLVLYLNWLCGNLEYGLAN